MRDLPLDLTKINVRQRDVCFFSHGCEYAMFLVCQLAIVCMHWVNISTALSCISTAEEINIYGKTIKKKLLFFCQMLLEQSICNSVVFRLQIFSIIIFLIGGLLLVIDVVFHSFPLNFESYTYWQCAASTWSCTAMDDAADVLQPFSSLDQCGNATIQTLSSDQPLNAALSQ